MASSMPFSLQYPKSRSAPQQLSRTPKVMEEKEIKEVAILLLSLLVLSQFQN
jgi:hypothetical protein